MDKRIVARMTNLAVILFLILTCLFTLFYNTKDRYKVHELHEDDIVIEEVSDSEKKFDVDITETPKKNVTYSCPPEYKLDGVNCVSVIDPLKTCGDMEEYASRGVEGCIKPNTGVSSVKGSCLDGQAIKNDKCYEVYSYTYYCPDGYNLKSKKCSSIIDAIES